MKLPARPNHRNILLEKWPLLCTRGYEAIVFAQVQHKQLLSRRMGSSLVSGFMTMPVKDKILFVWLVLAVVLSFFFSHFWEVAVYALERAVALGVLSVPVVSQFVAGIAGLHSFW